MKTFLEFLLIENRIRFENIIDWRSLYKILEDILIKNKNMIDIDEGEWYNFIFDESFDAFPVSLDDIPDKFYKRIEEFELALKANGLSEEEIKNILSSEQVDTEYKDMLKNYLQETGQLESYEYWSRDFFQYIYPIEIKPFREWFFNQIYYKLWDIKHNVKDNKIRLYRAMDLRSDWQEWIYQNKRSHVGVCWSYDEKGADTYCSEGGTRKEHGDGYEQFTLIGETDINAIDWYQTLGLMITQPGLWNTELELRPFKGALITLVGVIQKGKESDFTKGIEVRA